MPAVGTRVSRKPPCFNDAFSPHNQGAPQNVNSIFDRFLYYPFLNINDTCPSRGHIPKNEPPYGCPESGGQLHDNSLTQKSWLVVHSYETLTEYLPVSTARELGLQLSVSQLTIQDSGTTRKARPIYPHPLTHSSMINPSHIRRSSTATATAKPLDRYRYSANNMKNHTMTQTCVYNILVKYIDNIPFFSSRNNSHRPMSRAGNSVNE